jgi:hypothetical protein
MKLNCHFYCVDLKTLVETIEARRRLGMKPKRRIGEIWSACFFALCLEYNEGKRFLIGFPQRGRQPDIVTLEQLLSGSVGELDDWDVVLIPDLGQGRLQGREYHQCQLVSYCRRDNPGTEDLINFLEEKKLKKAMGGDLRLIVHLEQETGFEFDWIKIAAHLMIRRPKCQYQQVFMLGEFGSAENPYWHCRQMFPFMLPMRDLDRQTARQLLHDRLTYPTTELRQ